MSAPAYRVTAYRYKRESAYAYVVDAITEVATADEALRLMRAERTRTGCWPDVHRLKDGAYWDIDAQAFRSAA